MKAITFLLHTQQPILATSLQGDPNSDVSHDYILGSMIRGALIGRYLRQNNIKHTDDILDSQRFPDIKRLFFDASKTRYLNAYPVDIDKKRTLPIPLSWYKNKGEEFSEDKDKHIYDFSKIPIDNRDEDLSPKLLEEKFCTVSDSDVLLSRVKRRINIHNQRDRQRGKGTDSNGAVFSYDAIDAGQTFQAVILCDSEKDKTIIESLLELKDIWFGGSQSAGYGHTKIELIPNNVNWLEVETDLSTRLKQKEYLIITLLSDTIVRDECGQCVAEPEVLRQQISKYLKLKKELEFQENGIYASSLIVGGFNRKWGLPLPQTPAFAAGSVFVFQKADVDVEELQRLEEQGIGERRIEGFGRVTVNWLDEDTTEYQVKLPILKTENKQADSKSQSLSQDSLKIAEDITTRILKKNLDILLFKKVASTEIKREAISNSQLSRLMIISRQVLSQLEVEQTKAEPERQTIAKIAEPISSLLQNLPSNARSQFERTRLTTSERFDEQIHAWLQSPKNWIDVAWRSEAQTKNLVDHGQPSIKIADVQKTVDDYLALEYTLRLIMGITKKTIKEKNND
ncbi:MAG: type III-B CRISPR module-associated Cmr3 family protein [Nostochopsis sp.]